MGRHGVVIYRRNRKKTYELNLSRHITIRINSCGRYSFLRDILAAFSTKYVKSPTVWNKSKWLQWLDQSNCKAATHNTSVWQLNNWGSDLGWSVSQVTGHLHWNCASYVYICYYIYIHIVSFFCLLKSIKLSTQAGKWVTFLLCFTETEGLFLHFSFHYLSV